MQVSQTEKPKAEIVLDSGGWISGPGLAARHRPLARDTRTKRVGEVMVKAGAISANFWLRPVGGGIEWEVPKQYIELLADDDEAAA